MHKNKLTKKYFPVFPEESVLLTGLKRCKSQQLKCGLMKYYISATALKTQNTKFYEERCSFSRTDEHIFLCYSATHDQLWPVIERQSHSPDVKHYVIQFRPEDQHEPRNEVRSLNHVTHLVGFEPGTFQFYHNALTGWATLSKNQFIKTLLQKQQN